ncbi:MAG TPA: DJ-1/PfpI family protein [Candidatus Paceibacterota bacterium]|nr:DJ-1/PfpI family protein [Candidatus Paceibacterota bacterium]
MKKRFIYSTVLIIVGLGMVLWGVPLSLFAPQEAPPTTSTTQPDVYNKLNITMEKKILMVVAFKDFRDEEYFIPKEILEKAGFSIDTTSTKKGIAIGSQGGEAIVHIEMDEISLENYEAVIFCGGSGMANELDNQIFHKLAKDFYENNKTVAAICVAPALLAKAGILENKKATVWSSALDKSFIKILEENGAIYEDSPVIIDNNIITANGPDAAEEFGKAIKELLSN